MGYSRRRQRSASIVRRKQWGPKKLRSTNPKSPRRTKRPLGLSSDTVSDVCGWSISKIMLTRQMEKNFFHYVAIHPGVVEHAEKMTNPQEKSQSCRRKRQLRTYDTRLCRSLTYECNDAIASAVFSAPPRIGAIFCSTYSWMS